MLKTTTLLFAVVAILNAPAWACSCMPMTPEENFNLSAAVFSGTIVSLTLESTTQGMLHKATVFVTGCWKGAPLGFLTTVWTPETEDVCGIETFALNQEWLFYAHSAGGLGGYLTHLCDRTQPMPMLQEDADFLGASNCSPVSVDDVSWGRVKATYR